MDLPKNESSKAPIIKICKKHGELNISQVYRRGKYFQCKKCESINRINCRKMKMRPPNKAKATENYLTSACKYAVKDRPNFEDNPDSFDFSQLNNILYGG